VYCRCYLEFWAFLVPYFVHALASPWGFQVLLAEYHICQTLCMRNFSKFIIWNMAHHLIISYKVKCLLCRYFLKIENCEHSCHMWVHSTSACKSDFAFLCIMVNTVLLYMKWWSTVFYVIKYSTVFGILKLKMFINVWLNIFVFNYMASVLLQEEHILRSLMWCVL
jgi:hypothetical protein